MNKTLSREEGEEVRRRLKWLLGLRVSVVTIFLGSSLLLQVGFGRQLSSIHSFYFLIGATYLLTIVYALSLNQVTSSYLYAFAYGQIVLDLILETGLVFVTGGVQSPFSFLYLISVFSSGMILSRKGGVGAAAIASLLYGGLIDLQYYEVFPVLTSGGLTSKETFYILFLNIIAFFLVGYASGGVSEKLRKTGEALLKKDKGLTELKGYHEHIVHSMSSGLLTTDLEGRLTSFNRAAGEISGFSSDEIRGKRCWEVLDLEKLEEVFSVPRKIRLPYRFDGECHRKDKTKLLLGVTVSDLRSEGNSTGIIGIFQDLTHIREMEKEMKRKEKLATIGEMAAGMAHEIRNPLASLSGSMQVLRQEPLLNDEQKTLMNIALRETERLDSIITGFLRYAKPSPPNRKKCDLKSLLLETLDFFKQAQDYRENIKVFFEPEDRFLSASVDPDQMKQVFWNLSINAVQAMPEGGVLRVLARQANSGYGGENGSGEGSFSCFQVLFQDSGVGIEPVNLEKIFYPFFTTKDRGSGLGLAIVHRIIEDHGGKIEVESYLGKGTTFKILLPSHGP
ncbi:MAG TPA: ATP-binding protein [Nitrospiria bacterium]